MAATMVVIVSQVRSMRFAVLLCLAWTTAAGAEPASPPPSTPSPAAPPTVAPAQAMPRGPRQFMPDADRGATPDAGSTGAEGSDPGCRDIRRRLVRLLVVPRLGDAGRAEFAGGSPVIKIDPEIMAGLPITLQAFFKLHECAHHTLGHLFAPTLDSEKEADCWAMREGVRRKVFVATDVETWRPYLAGSRGSGMGHLPGPERLAFLAACVEE